MGWKGLLAILKTDHECIKDRFINFFTVGKEHIRVGEYTKSTIMRG